MRTSLFTADMEIPPSDAEVMEITRYTSGVMTLAEARRFEARLTSDRAFFCRAAPLLQIRYARKPAPAEERMLRGLDVPPAIADPRVQVRQHLRIALGSLGQMKAAIATLGLAAAGTFLYVAVPRERSNEESTARAVAQVHRDSTPAAPTQPPQTQIGVTPVASKHPPVPNGAKPPVIDIQVPVEPVEESPPLPALPDVAITPQARVGAAGDTIFVSASRWVAEQLNLGSDYNLMTPPTRPGNRSAKGTPKQAGSGWQLPLWLRFWDWQWLHGG